jgi:hypothetical protein
MGKLSMECLLGASLLNRKAGTCWTPNLSFTRAGVNKVWITNSTDAALYNPVMAVGISRILVRAAVEADLEPKIDYTLTMFDFANYMK